MSDGGFAIVIQPDDKIVVAGASNSQEDFVIVRYNPNGSLDNDPPGLSGLSYSRRGHR
jgi:hypothetical protein